MFNPVKLIKIARDKKFMQGLSDYHQALLLHLSYLNVKDSPDDFDIAFREAGKKYLELLESIGAPLEIPHVEPQGIAHETHDPFHP